MDMRTSDCLFSAAGALVPHQLASTNISIDKQIQQQIQIASTMGTKYEPTGYLTVSLCHGVSGVVQLFNSTSFVVIQSNSSYVHLQQISSMFFHEKMSSTDPLHKQLFHMADLTASRKKRFKRSFHMPVQLGHPGPFLVELYMIVDSKVASYNAHDNYRPLIKRIAFIINQMNMAFSLFNIYFTVVQLEIWEHDQMGITEHHVLTELQEYKRQYITKRHDCLHAILGENLGSSRRGRSEPSSMCGFSSCVGYTKDYAVQNEMELSHSVLHEIGHNFGLEHDTERCYCYDCIMATGVEFATSTLRWSNCSIQKMASLLHSGIADCLRDRPVSNLNELNSVIMKPNNVLVSLEVKSLSTCGNGIVDDGEQCDCGGSRCTPEFDRCCNPDTCRFRRYATCAGGTCCNLNSCSLKSSRTMCRTTGVNSCDLPEYCDGKTEWCPYDVYKEDLTVCTTSTTKQTSFCYLGNCHTRQSWCQVLWGKTANEASNDCFMMNKEGSKVKNCGLEIPEQKNRMSHPSNWNTKQCSNENAQCGRLWCSHDNERVLRSSKPVEKADEMIGTQHCSAIRFDMDFFMYDVGMVPNGAPCSYGKLCWQGMCIAPYPTSIKCLCNGHGVCNNNNNCHCNPGFAPPHCNTSGDGGSIDSGPPGKFHSTLRTVIVSIIITLIVILTVLLIASFIYHYRTRSWPLILRWIKVPNYRLPKFANETIKGDKKYAQVKHSYILNVDINSAGQKINTSPLQSPKSPDGSSKKDAFNRIRSFLEVKQSGAKDLLHSENCLPIKPIITKLVPESREGPEAPKILAQKPIPQVFSTAKAPPILVKKPMKIEETVPPPVSKEKPVILAEVHESKSYQPTSSKSSDVKALRQEMLAMFDSEKRPAITSAKPQKPGATFGPTISTVKPQKPGATFGPPISTAKPGKPEQGDNLKPAPKPDNVVKVPLVAVQKKADQKFTSKSIVKDPQVLPNKMPQNRSKPVSKVSLNSLKLAKAVPNKIPDAKMEILNKKLESAISKTQTSQLKLELTSNQSVTLSKPEKVTPALSKPPVLQSGDNALRILSPGSAKTQKPVEIKDLEKPGKLSKLEISQPRLNLTTCTDATVSLATTDRTLTRTVVPHKILQCDPSRAGKYL